MFVERIEISGFTAARRGQMAEGAVTLVAADTRLQIPLTMPHRADLARRKQRLLLLAAALKQARRLPEFRGDGALRFAPGLLPEPLRRA